MTLDDLRTLLTNRLAFLAQQQTQATLTGDAGVIKQVNDDIAETTSTLYALNTLG
jgi:hypothetical protein